MTRYTGDGRAITKAVQAAITKAGVTMDLTATWDHLPNEHRARVRADETLAVRNAREEGRAALDAWARAERADATRRLSARTIGSAAEESRRTSDELRIGRLVASARAGGNARAAAADLAEKAERAFEAGSIDEADVLARASQELGGPNLADDVAAHVERVRIELDPARARALRELNDVEVVVAAYERDVSAAASQALQHSAALARALGDPHGQQTAMTEAGAEGRTAKIAAFLQAREAGVQYVEPAGVLPGGPTGSAGGKLPGSLA